MNNILKKFWRMFAKKNYYFSEADQLLKTIRGKNLHSTLGQANKENYYKALRIKRDGS